MENDSRVKKSVKNISYAMIGYFVSLILQLVNRLVFVRLLSMEYLGINGLFYNILYMLSLSELGVGSAIVYALYKPVAENDVEKIKSFMALYKKLYSFIGWFVLIVGVFLTPFIQFFIKDMPDIQYIRIYFMLYVFNSGISYFYTYKRSLIICNQEEYISTTTTMLASVATKFFQIVVLLVTRSYMFFLITQIVFTRIENIIIAKIADKKYPYLKEKDVLMLEKEDTDRIKKNVFAMMLHKLGDVVVNATDSLIVSKILGLVSVGLISNYSMIFEAISGLVTKIFSAITASLGNLAVLESSNKAEKVFYRILFGNFWLISFCSICLRCLIQPFIRLWIGDDFLLSEEFVLALTACFYLSGMRRTALQFRTAVGLFWYDRYKALVESILNLSISVPLTLYMGVTGVKLGTVISMLLTSFWIEGFILYRYYFRKKVAPYLFLQTLYFGITLVADIVVNYVCKMIPDMSTLTFVIKCIICVVGVNGFYLLLFFNKPEFRYYIDMLMRKNN